MGTGSSIEVVGGQGEKKVHRGDVGGRGGQGPKMGAGNSARGGNHGNPPTSDEGRGCPGDCPSMTKVNASRKSVHLGRPLNSTRPNKWGHSQKGPFIWRRLASLELAVMRGGGLTSPVFLSLSGASPSVSVGGSGMLKAL